MVTQRHDNKNDALAFVIFCYFFINACMYCSPVCVCVCVCVPVLMYYLVCDDV